MSLLTVVNTMIAAVLSTDVPRFQSYLVRSHTSVDVAQHLRASSRIVKNF